jgi:hypothetical protein
MDFKKGYSLLFPFFIVLITQKVYSKMYEYVHMNIEQTKICLKAAMLPKS